MVILNNTMFVIPLPGVIGVGVPVNLDIGSPRIIDLKRKKSLDDDEVRIAFYYLFSQLGPFFL